MDVQVPGSQADTLGPSGASQPLQALSSHFWLMHLTKTRLETVISVISGTVHGGSLLFSNPLFVGPIKAAMAHSAPLRLFGRRDKRVFGTINLK